MLDANKSDEPSPRFGAFGLWDSGFGYRDMSPVEAGTSNPQNLNGGPSRNSADTANLPDNRLFHTVTGIMITTENRKTFIPDGIVFDRVSTCCQQMAQQQLRETYGLVETSLFKYEGESIPALISPRLLNGAMDSSYDKNRPILMVIPGKGKSRAGILSVKQLLTAGLERGSAIYHIDQAIRRDWSVIALDPNARGKTEGKILIRWALDHLEGVMAQHPLFVLAHSAAGGYFAQYLLDGENRRQLLLNLRALLFTDSTHNINWARDNREVLYFLQSERSLYIRNCSEHPSDTFANHKNKKAGDRHEGNAHWYRRFGDIPTVWAGTVDHSAMCWVAREVIWNFFDERDERNNASLKREIPIAPFRFACMEQDFSLPTSRSFSGKSVPAASEIPPLSISGTSLPPISRISPPTIMKTSPEVTGALKRFPPSEEDGVNVPSISGTPLPSISRSLPPEIMKTSPEVTGALKRLPQLEENGVSKFTWAFRAFSIAVVFVIVVGSIVFQR